MEILTLVCIGLALVLVIQHRQIKRLNLISASLERRLIHLTCIAVQLAGGKVVMYGDSYKLDMPESFRLRPPVDMTNLTAEEAEGRRPTA